MIELKEINKTYKSKKGEKVVALNNVNIDLPEKGLVFILGKSGSGKSTLLNVIGGLDKYDSGDLIINNKSTKKYTPKDWDAYRNTFIGFIFQDFNLLDNYSIEKNISLSLVLQNKKVNKNLLQEILQKVGLDDILKRKTNELSGGQKQRIAIARALIKNPKVILADEPTGNLDSVTSRQIFGILKELSKDKLVIVVSHDEEAAYRYNDYLIKISDGNIIENSINDIDNTNSDGELVKARLPLGYSIKMGIENLFHKKIKLLFTILLLSLSLSCFGLLLSSTNYDSAKEVKDKIMLSNSKYIYITQYEKVFDNKQLLIDSLAGYSENNIPTVIDMESSTIKEIEDNTKINWTKSYFIKQNDGYAYISFIKDYSESMLYYKSGLTLSFINYNDDNEAKKSNIIGKAPVNDNEIVITKYIADNIIAEGILIEDENSTVQNYYPNSYNQIVNEQKNIIVDNIKSLKIVGILDSNMDKYSSIKNLLVLDYGYSSDYDLIMNDFYFDSEHFFSNIYVSDGFLDYLSLKNVSVINSSTKYLYNNTLGVYNQSKYIDDKVSVYDGNSVIEFSELTGNNVIINMNIVNKLFDGDYSIKLYDYMKDNPLAEENDISDFNKKYIDSHNIINTKIKTGINNKTSYVFLENFGEYTIVGIDLNDSSNSSIYYSKSVFNDSTFENTITNTVYTYINTEEEYDNIAKYYPVDKSNIIIRTSDTVNILSFEIITSIIGIIGKYGSFLFIIISTLLLVNYIANSVSYRKKEIGTLRALGCRSKDMMIMFIVESFIIMLISMTISGIVTFNVVQVINGAFSSVFDNDCSILIFGISQLITVYLILLGIMIIANYLPLKRISKMKPIDVILNK